MSRYLVYTCVTNNYDKIRKVLSKQDSNIDFVCFTDKVNKQLDLRPQTGWIFMPIPGELRRLDARRQARMIKIGIFKYLKGYSGYLWIDAPIIVIGNIGDFIKEHPFSENRNMYVSKHYMRDCVYQEFAQVLRLNKDRSACVYNQYERYKNMGYPKHNGMAETSILYRNFNDLKVQTHAVVWADEIMNYSYRDQLSFNWTAWSTKTPITYLNEDIYKRDTENEKSKYFFLPWPKHNNPSVVQQLEKRLKKNPLPNILVGALQQEQKVEVKSKSTTTNNTTIASFEQEYQQFLADLKKKQEKKETVKPVEKPVESKKPVEKETPPVKEEEKKPAEPIIVEEKIAEPEVVVEQVEAETIDNSVQSETVVEATPVETPTEISNTKIDEPVEEKKPLEKKKRRKYNRRKK